MNSSNPLVIELDIASLVDDNCFHERIADRVDRAVEKLGYDVTQVSYDVEYSSVVVTIYLPEE